MESSEDVEALSRAIEKLLDEKRKREAAGDAFIEDQDDQLFLSSLISQLKSPELRRKTGKADEPPKEEAEESGEREEHMEVSIEELAKDIKEVKRQNTITHLLLSAMIILTVTLQISEFSMVFMMKDRLISVYLVVNSLRQELQLLSSNRPITIVTTAGSGSRKYGLIIIIGVIGYGYVWWKGWKLPDFMFATRRSLSDACNNVGNQIDGFYSSLSSTRRELTSKVDKMGRSLDTNTEIIQETGREVTELRDGTAKMEDNVRSALDAVENLANKVHRIEGNQDFTLNGVGALHAQCRRFQESNQALPSTSSIPALEPAPMTPSSRQTLSLPPTPNGAPQSHGTLHHTQSMSGLKDINESPISRETSSNGTQSGEAMGNSSSATSSGLFSMFSRPRIIKTRSSINPLRTNSIGPQ